MRACLLRKVLGRLKGDYAVFLWLLKLGALANLYFSVSTAGLLRHADALVVALAQVLFVVSAYRCLFPVRYEGHVVLHDTVSSSIFATRVLATFSEVAYVFLLSLVLRRLDAARVVWVDALSWYMVVQVVISQVFVWRALLTGRLVLYFYEELGWALIFAANTAASAYLLRTAAAPPPGGLLELSLVFGAVYLPFQLVHLRALLANARQPHAHTAPAAGLIRAIRTKNQRTDAASWGGPVGLLWMMGYWATAIPLWIHHIVVVLPLAGPAAAR